MSPDTARLSDLDQVIPGVLSAILVITGLIFLCMLVVSGFNYLNSGSNKDAAAKAQRSLNYTLMGLVITVAAWALLKLLGTFLGITNFGNTTICIIPGC